MTARALANQLELTRNFKLMALGSVDSPLVILLAVCADAVHADALQRQHVAPPTTVTIDAGAALGSAVSSLMLGVSQGPHIQSSWLSHEFGHGKYDGDWSAGMARVGVPSIRTHGMGCVDLDQLWIPCSGGAGTGCNFAGFDAWDDVNYNWTQSDACLKAVYENPLLPDLNATIRIGHSRVREMDFPSFCQGPDDVDVFANVTAAIIHRYTVVKGYAQRDFSVWNEPTNKLYHRDDDNDATATDGDDDAPTPFYCRSPGTYASMYAAIWSRVKPMFGDRVNIGVSLDRSNYSKAVVKYLSGNGSSFDFIDTHFYYNTPSKMPWSVHKTTASGTGGVSLETMLHDAGFDSKTRLQIGEWSRQIPWYAQDIPGAAYVACGLAYLNEMTLSNSGGEHNVGSAHIFSVQKVWDGHANNASNVTDLNAATIFNWWARMVGATHLATTGARQPYPMGTDPTNLDEMCVLAARHGNDEILAVFSHYYAPSKTIRPTIGPCFALTVEVSGITWPEWTWTQYSNDQMGVLPAVAHGNSSGASASLALCARSNSFSTLRIAPAAVSERQEPEGARRDKYDRY